jgi:hypothetical protein
MTIGGSGELSGFINLKNVILEPDRAKDLMFLGAIRRTLPTMLSTPQLVNSPYKISARGIIITVISSNY